MRLVEFLEKTNSEREDMIVWDEATALRKVKQDGYSLRYVKEQTPEICIEAVKQDGDSLRYVNINIFDSEQSDSIPNRKEKP